MLPAAFVVDLSAAITSEAMIPVLANAEVQQRLIPLLPEAAELPKTEAELRETMHSPQFHQVLICLIVWIHFSHIVTGATNSIGVFILLVIVGSALNVASLNANNRMFLQKYSFIVLCG